MKNNLEWQQKDKVTLLSTAIATITETTSISPDKTTGRYIVMDAPDWVIVIPELTETNEFLMVKQWRHGIQRLSIEFPGGVIDKNESIEDAAKRELQEETGYTTNHLIHLGSLSPNPAIMSNTVHIFLAQDLTKTSEQDLDSDEYVDFLKMSKQEVFEKMGTKDFPHALMSSALNLYRTYNEQ